MSTPTWKKRKRQEEQAKQKRKAEYEKKFKITKAASKKKSNETKIQTKETTYYRETPNYPSDTSSKPISYARQEPKQYTGDYIKGIAVMHKSNLVPVSAETDPRDYSTMRRN